MDAGGGRAGISREGEEGIVKTSRPTLGRTVHPAVNFLISTSANSLKKKKNTPAFHIPNL